MVPRKYGSRGQDDKPGSRCGIVPQTLPAGSAHFVWHLVVLGGSALHFFAAAGPACGQRPERHP